MGHPARLSTTTVWSILPTLAALCIGLATVGSGLRVDDYLQGGHLKATIAGTNGSQWWDIYFLADFDAGKRFSGAMPWWTVDDLHIRFFRPLSAASHLLDQVAWPTRPWMMHVHSVGLHAVFVTLVAVLYRRYFSAKRAAIAAVVFAISVNHASTVTWIANRNALLAALFGVATLLLFHDGCAGKWRGLLAIPCLVAALLSAEAGIGVFGLLLVLPPPNRDSARSSQHSRRRWTLAFALVAVAITWRVLYSHYGFGAVGSGAYIDPIRSPSLFLAHLPERLGWLGAMSLAPVKLLVEHPSLSLAARLILGFFFMVVAASILRAALSPEHRWWAAGGLLAIVPLAASTPGERLLTIAFIGFCPAIAGSILRLQQPDVLNRVSGLATTAAHLAISPALFISYAVNFQPAHPLGFKLEDTKSRNLVLISAPSVLDVTHLLESRVVHGLPRPSFTWYLWTSENPTYRRRGCCSLELEDPDGHAREAYSAYFRSQESPLVAGQMVKTLGYDVEVIDVDRDGYATKARFNFRVPLEHTNLVFADWTGEDFQIVTLPTDPS